MLQHFPTSSYYLKCWQDESKAHDYGLSYIGKSSSSPAVFNKTIFDNIDNISDCSRDNKSHILENFEESWDITPNELSQMKRIYEDGNEPVPSSFEDESENWVSREFLKVIPILIILLITLLMIIIIIPLILTLTFTIIGRFRIL